MTAQISESLVFKGISYPMTTTAPLETYLNLHVYSLLSNPSNTALLRGYYGNWEINNLGRLYLTHLQGTLHLFNERMYSAARNLLRKELRNGQVTQKEYTSQLRATRNACSYEKPATLESIFESAEPVFAYWYNGPIRLEYGDLIQHHHIGFMSEYSHTKILLMDHGIMSKEIDPGQ